MLALLCRFWPVTPFHSSPSELTSLLKCLISKHFLGGVWVNFRIPNGMVGHRTFMRIYNNELGNCEAGEMEANVYNCQSCCIRGFGYLRSDYYWPLQCYQFNILFRVNDAHFRSERHSLILRWNVSYILQVSQYS